MERSTRLKTVAEAVTPGLIPADIGTDHGYVPIYLVKHGICPRVLAMDINPGPLARAREHIRKEGLEDRIVTRQSDGLSGLGLEEADSIIIAGMGGQLICRILEQAPHILEAGKELILSPHSEWFKVRHLLHDHHYLIVKEWFLKEDGKYYVVIKAWPESAAGPGTESQVESPDGSVTKEESQIFDEEICYQYGRYLLEENNPVLYEYLQEEVRKKKDILSRLALVDKEETPRYKEIEEMLRSLEKAISLMD